MSGEIEKTELPEKQSQSVNDSGESSSREESPKPFTGNSDEPTKEQTKKPQKSAHWDEKPPEVQNGPPNYPESDEPWDGREELTEEEAYDQLGFNFPTWKKWLILTVIFWIQLSMNFNSSVFSNAVTGISEEFNVSAQAARCGAMIFLVAYAFGCELWAPWSEELGRWPILQLSLFLVNIWQLPVALAKNFGTLMVGRFFGGLCSAGGSVTLGMVADMWEAEDQQYAVAFVVFSSVGGTVVGPLVGAFIEATCDWRWNIWVQLIFGGVVQIAHFFLVAETRSTVMMDKIAKKLRKSGKRPNVYGPNEMVPFWQRFSAKEILVTWIRPFRMYFTEPIVLSLSLLSGFSDALIFIFMQSYNLVYAQWDFSTIAIGLAFLPIFVGYFIAWISFIPAFWRNERQRKANPGDERAQYESRLWWLLYTAPCLPIGLIGFAWTTQGPPIHWIGSMVFSTLIGLANYAIYMATIDYMITAYGPYSASATGGNGWSRDFLAGVLTIPATPFYSNIGSKPLPYGSTILFCISFVLVLAVYVVYFKGPELRVRSKFAQQLSDARKENQGRRVTSLPSLSSRNQSRAGSRNASRGPSRNQSYLGSSSRNQSRRTSATHPAERPNLVPGNSSYLNSRIKELSPE